MKVISTLLTLLFLTTSYFADAQKRKLDFTVKGAENDTVHLAHYYGNKLYYKDTTICSPQGKCSFSREKDFPGGVYALVVGKQAYVEVVVDENEIDIHTDAADLNGSMDVKKSTNNKVFHDYVQFLGGHRKNAENLGNKLKETSDPIAKAQIEEELKKVDEQVKEYQKTLMTEHADHFVADLVRMSVSVELEEPLKPDGSLDSAASYYQYRKHFWDHFDLTDPRIVHTPVFHNKLDEYVSRVIPQVPDTITKLVDALIEKTGQSHEVFKYITHFVTHKYETSEIMGMDAVFAHMGLKYYCPDVNGNSRVDWMSDDKLEQLCERVTKLSPLLIGKKAPYLKLTDTTEQNWVAYYDLPEDYVVIVFWDPHCGACKKELPVLAELYKSELKQLGVEVYAVAKAVEEKAFKDWKSFIKEHELDWVNVGLTMNIYNEAKANPGKFIPSLTTLASLNYSDTWDVYSTPKLFIVDKNRRIIAKQLAAEQIVDLIVRKQEETSGQSE